MMDQGLNWIKVKQNKGYLVQLVAIITFIAFLLLFTFQNCSSPLEINNQNSSNLQNTLAFDTALGTIAYMSCSNKGTGYNQGAYFTFLGASFDSSSGVRLSKAFLSNTKNWTPGQRADALSESKTNANATLQISVRPRNNLQRVVTSSNNNSASEGREFSNILASLGKPPIASLLVNLKEGKRLQYISGTPGLDRRLLVGRLHFTDSKETEVSLRDSLQNSSLLTVTYTDSSVTENIVALSPNTKDHKKAYGRGYQIDFHIGHTLAPSGGRFRRGEHRVIHSIREIDLQTKHPTQHPWECPYALMIVRPEDIGTICRTLPDPLNPSNDQRQALKAIRNVLRHSHWWVDLDKNCIVPKGPSRVCYGSGTIDYTGASTRGDCTANNHSCPHYVSICTRK